MRFHLIQYCFTLCLTVVDIRKGDYPQALQCCHQSLAIREKILGVNHPQVSDALNNMAAVVEAQVGAVVRIRTRFLSQEQAILPEREIRGTNGNGKD